VAGDKGPCSRSITLAPCQDGEENGKAKAKLVCRDKCSLEEQQMK